MTKENKKKTTEKEEKMIVGSFKFAIPMKDLEKLRKNPKARIRKQYSDMFIDTIIGIDVKNINKEDEIN